MDRITQGIPNGMFETVSKEEAYNELVGILTNAKNDGASDVHFTPGSPIVFRVNGKLCFQNDEKLIPDRINRMVCSILVPEQYSELAAKGEIDLSFSIPNLGRMRINVFKQRGTFAMAVRLLSFEIPSVEALGLPDVVADFANRKRGLVLVTGPTGSGKSTTLAALIDRINKTQAKHIITLEDPLEYLHRHEMSIVTQREMGLDSHSYADALRAALRQDPDVILVGEMRDLETISTAITAAETGHLVFSTLHTKDAASAIDRIIDVFPPHQQQQIKVQLASVVEGVIAQQLLPCKDSEGGRVAAFEVMVSNPAIRNLIREGKTFQISSVMQTGKKEGMQVMDDAILDFYRRGLISKETAVAYAQDAGMMEVKVQL